MLHGTSSAAYAVIVSQRGTARHVRRDPAIRVFIRRIRLEFAP
jgi:hypothetical protein